VLLLCCVSGEAQSTSSSSNTLPIELYKNYLIVVRGSIGNLENRRFIIDTGAYPTVISPRVAKKLRLSGHKEEVRVVGHNINSDVMYVPLLQLGPLQSRNLRAVVRDLSVFDRDVGVQIDAMVGLDVLRQSRFRIDYQERKLIFAAPGSLPFITPIRWDGEKACIDVDVNGKPTRLLLDSGAADVMLFEQKFADLSNKPGLGWTSANLGGRFAIRQIRLKSLGAGTELGAREVFVSDADNMTSFAFAGLMAIGAERFRRVEFDFERQIFSWEPVKWKGRDTPVARAAATPVSSPPTAFTDGRAQTGTSEVCAKRFFRGRHLRLWVSRDSDQTGTIVFAPVKASVHSPAKYSKAWVCSPHTVRGSRYTVFPVVPTAVARKR
jgi:hypothetical protein